MFFLSLGYAFAVFKHHYLQRPGDNWRIKCGEFEGPRLLHWYRMCFFSPFFCANSY
jgi:hypothetical protein